MGSQTKMTKLPVARKEGGSNPGRIVGPKGVMTLRELGKVLEVEKGSKGGG